MLPPEPDEIIQELRDANEQERIRNGFQEVRLRKAIEQLKKQVLEERLLIAKYIAASVLDREELSQAVRKGHHLPLAQRLRDWLGKGGYAFFSGLYAKYGEDLSSIVYPEEGAGNIPHPVHLREGMTVRNWLREQPECVDWDAHRFDAEWGPLVIAAIRL